MSPTLDHIRIEKIDPSEVEEMIAFGVSDYLLEEPLAKSLGINKSHAFEEFIRISVLEGHSFKAIDTSQNNRLIGFRVTGLCVKGQNQNVELPAEAEFDKINAIVDTAKERCQLFERYPAVDSYFEGRLLSVLKEYRGQGVAGKLMDATFELMRELDVKLMYIGCTSQFMVNVLKKCGFEVIDTVPYSDWMVDGQRVFNTEAPHVAFTSCVKLMV